MRLTFLDPGGELTDKLLTDVLNLVGCRILSHRITDLTPNERALLYDWGMREHYRASDNLIRRRPKPLLLTLLENEYEEH
jgi:hypothetical protein